MLRAAAERNSRITASPSARSLPPSCDEMQASRVSTPWTTARLQIVMKPKREKENKIKEHGSRKTQVAGNFVAQGLGLASGTYYDGVGEPRESLSERVPQIRDWEGVGARCGACESKVCKAIDMVLAKESSQANWRK